MSVIHEPNVRARYLKDFEELEARYSKWLGEAHARIEALERVAAAARLVNFKIFDAETQRWVASELDDALEALDSYTSSGIRTPETK